MSIEKDAWLLLSLSGAIPGDEHFSPTKAKDGYYTELQRARPSDPDLDPSHPDVGKVKSVKQLRESKEPKTWIIEEFGTRGACVLLAAEAGSGKTSLLYQMASSISQGEMFMGQLRKTKVRVLIVQADESQTNAADKLDTMGIDAEFEFLFPDEHGWEGLDLEGLKNEIKFCSYGAVLLNCITTLIGNGTQGLRMNDPEFAAPIYA